MGVAGTYHSPEPGKSPSTTPGLPLVHWEFGLPIEFGSGIWKPHTEFGGDLISPGRSDIEGRGWDMLLLYVTIMLYHFLRCEWSYCIYFTLSPTHYIYAYKLDVEAGNWKFESESGKLVIFSGLESHRGVWLLNVTLQADKSQTIPCSRAYCNIND